MAFVRRWYFAFAIVLFVFSPELRRIADYLTSVHKLSPFSVLPLAAMLPGVFLALGARKRLGSFYGLVATIWLGAFGVALFIGALSGSLIAALYDMLTFATPISIGIFLATMNEDLPALYRRVAGTLLAIAVVASAYAIYQYVAPPPWDVFWVLNSGLVSTGLPEPFGLRVFGPLNSYAVFAHFLALTLVLNLPRVGRSNWRSVIAYVPCAIALLLTSDRTAWLAFTAGLVIFLAVAPRRVVAFKALGLVTILAAAVSATLLVSLKGSDDVVNLLQQRFASLEDIGEDNSFNDRQLQTRRAIRQGTQEPLGQGLGEVGTAANAGASQSTNTLDNGYLARFVELGVAGCAAYLIALGLALYAVFRALRTSLRGAPSSSMPNVLAAAFAVQIMMLGIDISTDSHNGLLGVFFWFSIYLGSRYISEAALPKRSARSGIDESRPRSLRILVID